MTATPLPLADADTILAIPADRPERLFHGSDHADQALYRSLVARWHPDRHLGDARALAVFQRIRELYDNRARALAAGTWPGPGEVTFTTTSGRTLRLRYARQWPFELGRCYLSRTSLTYALSADHADLGRRAMQTIRGLRYASDRMQEEFSRYLPNVDQVLETPTGPVLILSKTEELVRLRDLLTHLGGPLDPRHVAWVMTRLHNLACYLTWAGLTHNAIDLDSCFVSPEYHTVSLLGGWWYAAPVRERLAVLPTTSAGVWRTLPPAVTAPKLATRRLDRELVRAVGRELLGDPGGTRILHDARVPEPMARWLTMPSRGDAMADFQGWAEARDASYARKFVKLEVSSGEVYGW